MARSLIDVSKILTSRVYVTIEIENLPAAIIDVGYLGELGLVTIEQFPCTFRCRLSECYKCMHFLFTFTVPISLQQLAAALKAPGMCVTVRSGYGNYRV